MSCRSAGSAQDADGAAETAGETAGGLAVGATEGVTDGATDGTTDGTVELDAAGELEADADGAGVMRRRCSGRAMIVFSLFFE